MVQAGPLKCFEENLRVLKDIFEVGLEVFGVELEIFRKGFEIWLWKFWEVFEIDFEDDLKCFEIT